MSKSILYASNTISQATTATGTTLNFGTAVRRYGCNVGMSGGNIIVSGSGYYDVDVSLMFTAGGAGTAQVQVLKDGTAITGATATVTTADATSYAISVPCVVRNTCCCESTISVVVSGVAGTVTNSSAVVEKL